MPASEVSRACQPATRGELGARSTPASEAGRTLPPPVPRDSGELDASELSQPRLPAFKAWTLGELDAGELGRTHLPAGDTERRPGARSTPAS
jgi:hypothetical protein